MPKLYGSVLGLSKEIKKLYGSVPQTVVTSVTGTTRSGGTGNVTAFDADTFWAAASSSLASTAVSYIKVISQGGLGAYNLDVYYSDGSSTTHLEHTVSSGVLATYGITAVSPSSVGQDYIDMVVTTEQQDASKKIIKLYGSVNGQTKLIYEE